MEQLTEIVLTIVMVLITTLVAWLTTKFTNLIDTKIKDAKSKSLLNDAIGVVTRVVKETTQTYVDSLKDRNMFDKKAQQEALQMTKEKVKAQLKSSVKEYIEQNFNGFDNWLTTTIEAKLYDLKKKE
ncbi:MAG: hypothetical protein HPY96_00580 [Bacilli bacterium]|nr:hypothetical protein [Bacilli bacterium]